MTSISPESIAAGDFNRDGRVDIALVGSDGVEVRTNSGRWGTYNFSAPRDEWPICVFNRAGALHPHHPRLFDTSAEYEILGAHDFAVVDFDKDDDLDIALPVTADNKLIVLMNKNGIFTNPHGSLRTKTFPLGNSPKAIVAGDFDQDGRIELAIVHEETGDIWILHQRANRVDMPPRCPLFDKKLLSATTPRSLKPFSALSRETAYLLAIKMVNSGCLTECPVF